jgi:hypothetical protein
MFRHKRAHCGVLQRLDRLEQRMSAVDDIIAALNAATNVLAEKLAALQAEVAAGGDPVATAARFQPILDELTALGADPANPVPPAVG